tara:strand:- start:1062 stop:1166 length:105 start_codon:yes stop_codon:yes gene_type:complete
MDIIALIITFGTGFAAGMYVCSQIEKRIDKNTKK